MTQRTNILASSALEEMERLLVAYRGADWQPIPPDASPDEASMLSTAQMDVAGDAMSKLQPMLLEHAPALLTAARDGMEVAGLRKRVKTLERMDREAATYVESVICMRTHFTGDEPYVGWKGLGLALRETLDERDALKARVAELEAALKPFAEEAEYWPDASDGMVFADSEPMGNGDLTVGDLRRARAALGESTDE